MDLEALPTELWIRCFAAADFRTIWLGLRSASRLFRTLGNEAVSEKFRRGRYVVRVGWDRPGESGNVVDLAFESFDGGRFTFRPAGRSCFETPFKLLGSAGGDEAELKWFRDFGPLSLVEEGAGHRLQISRSWCLYGSGEGASPSDAPAIEDWSSDLRVWPPAWVRSYPAAEDYVLDASLDPAAGTVLVSSLVCTASFVCPFLMSDPPGSRPPAAALRSKLPLYGPDLVTFVRTRAASAFSIRDTPAERIEDDPGVRLWLARAGAGLRNDGLLDGQLERISLWRAAERGLAGMLMRSGGMELSKALTLSDAYILEWIQACRKRDGAPPAGARAVWQRRKMHLVHLLSQGKPQAEREGVRRQVDAILPD
ncbi:hypothetical protein DFJ74DRAFT_444928 [Hyaloraphidium curvatum]|nr:hypothetical protein DFJ74DRAFT_444928 [Hyaloraphidium curvatum]